MRKKTIIINFLTDFMPQIIIALLGIFKIKIFLNNWGEDLLGLYQLYSQFFSYLAIVEIGISSGILYTLYKPTVDKNYKELKKIYNGSKYTFNIIGTLIIILGLILSLFIGFFIKNNTFDFWFLQVTFTLYVLANVINYFYMSKKLLFYAKEKNYVPNLIYQICTVIKSGLEIILVMMNFKLIHVLIIGLIISLLSNLILEAFFHKEFNYLPKVKEKKFAFSKNLKPIILQKVSNLVTNNIDIILLSKFIGLGHVVIYTTYQYITLSLQLITDKISNSVLTSVGNILTVDKKRASEIFDKINNTLYIVGIALCIPLLFVLNSFIDIWYNYSITTNNILAILFVTLLFLNIIRQIFNLFINACGIFKETKVCSIIELLTNLILSLILVFKFEIEGVLIATIVSIIISDFILKNKIILKNICNKNMSYYYKISFKYLIIMIVNFTIGLFIFKNIVFDNILIWLIGGIITFAVNFGLLFFQLWIYSKIERRKK